MNRIYKLRLLLAVSILVITTTTIKAQIPYNDPAWHLRVDSSDYFYHEAKVDSSFWYTEYPWGPYNNGAEYNTPSDLTIGSSSTYLQIEADTTIPGFTTTGTHYDSLWNTNSPRTLTYAYKGGAIQTRPTDTGCGTDLYKFGYIQLSAKYPTGYYDYWPAFWLWSGCGLVTGSDGWYNEIDIAENEPATSFYGNQMLHNVYTRNDSANKYGTYNSAMIVNTGFTVSAAFHKYAVEWEPNKITWYIDNLPVRTYSNPSGITIPQHPMAAIINFAVNPDSAWLPVNWNSVRVNPPTGIHGNASPTKWPSYFEVDSLLYYTLNTNCSNNLTICTPATDYSTRAVEESITTGGSCSPTFNTSSGYTLRATNYVELGKGTTINANGSGYFAIETLPCPN